MPCFHEGYAPCERCGALYDRMTMNPDSKTRECVTCQREREEQPHEPYDWDIVRPLFRRVTRQR